MNVRVPARSGSFYPESPEACSAQSRSMCIADENVPGYGTLFGGIVPHAGWMYSGAIAGRVFATLSSQCEPETVVVFGAVHRGRGHQAWMYGSGCWETPLGQIEIDQRLAQGILARTDYVVDDPDVHEHEHSIEVQVPFIQQTMPASKMLPIMMPPVTTAPDVGRIVVEEANKLGINVLLIGSTDLTHYGPSYGMVSQGQGRHALAWAKEVNDSRMIELMLGLQAEQVVAEAFEHGNACGSGAVAATLAGVRQLGASKGILLDHSTSAEVTGTVEASDAVGYAGVVFAA